MPIATGEAQTLQGLSNVDKVRQGRPVLWNLFLAMILTTRSAWHTMRLVHFIVSLSVVIVSSVFGAIILIIFKFAVFLLPSGLLV